MIQVFKRDNLLFGITAFGLLAGLILSVVSWLRLCSGACAESHNWHFFGWPFETLGLLFFIPVNLLFWIAKFRPSARAFLSTGIGLMVAGAVGAEIHFILVQKYEIGAWCPVCLSIAASVGVAAIGFAIKYLDEIAHHERGNYMTSLLKGYAGLSVCALGFLLSLIGVVKTDPLAAVEATIKESLVFGEKESHIEVYIFTDWACPACRALEASIDTLAPAIMQKARLTFVDLAVHTQTLNYSPYNVSFMIHNKAEYFKLRDDLTKLSLKTGTPKDEQIEKIAKSNHTQYEQLNFSDIALSQKYFKQLSKQFGVNQTPTAIVLNRETRKGKKLIGVDEISEANVLKAIASLSK
ncbi:MAG: thioredoxin domain-containing protein [Parachlamydia sp.]|nr:thioredoxin domain-containing protein [Parachlamydia sp.]